MIISCIQCHVNSPIWNAKPVSWYITSGLGTITLITNRGGGRGVYHLCYYLHYRRRLCDYRRCLFFSRTSNIVDERMNGFKWNFPDRFGMIKGTICQTLAVPDYYLSTGLFPAQRFVLTVCFLYNWCSRFVAQNIARVLDSSQIYATGANNVEVSCIHACIRVDTYLFDSMVWYFDFALRLSSFFI